MVDDNNVGGQLADQAVGFLELKGAAHGMVALDAVCKAAPVDVLEAQVVCPGKFTILFTGLLASVTTAHGAAVARVGPGLYDSCVIGRIHPALARGLSGIFPGLDARKTSTEAKEEALGVLETLSMASGIEAADVALKAGSVKLRELRLGYALGGRSYLVISGEIGSVGAALDAATKLVTELGLLGSHCLIPRPKA
mgnify:FL=1